jgi:hypothetical protein
MRNAVGMQRQPATHHFRDYKYTGKDAAPLRPYENHLEKFVDIGLL